MRNMFAILFSSHIIQGHHVPIFNPMVSKSQGVQFLIEQL